MGSIYVIEDFTAWNVYVFGVLLVRIQSECGKIRTKKTPNTDTFHAVFMINTDRTFLTKFVVHYFSRFPKTNIKRGNCEFLKLSQGQRLD